MTEVKQKKVVSVKLDTSTQTEIEQKAAELGLSISDYLRKIIADAKEINKPLAAAVVKDPVSLDDSTLGIIAAIINDVVKGSLPSKIEVVSPTAINPERDFLRKIAGLAPEYEETLTVDEEVYLTDLKNAITADVRSNLLLKENSIAIPQADTPLKIKTFKEMAEQREAMQSENTPTFTEVFQKAISQAFFDDARTLYNKGLFKATYDMEWREFKAIFQLD